MCERQKQFWIFFWNIFWHLIKHWVSDKEQITPSHIIFFFLFSQNNFVQSKRKIFFSFLVRYEKILKALLVWALTNDLELSSSLAQKNLLSLQN